MSNLLAYEQRIAGLERLVASRLSAGLSRDALVLVVRSIERFALSELTSNELVRIAHVFLDAAPGLSDDKHVLVGMIAKLDPDRVCIALLKEIESRVGRSRFDERDVLSAQAYRLRALFGAGVPFPTASDPSERDPVVLSNIAVEHKRAGRFAEAEALYQRALAACGDDMNAAATIANNLGRLYGEMRRFDEARDWLKRALDLWISMDRPAHARVLACLNNLAGLEQIAGGSATALKWLREAVAIVEASPESDASRSSEAANVLHNLGALLLELNQAAEARGYLERALALNVASVGSTHPRSLTTQRELARAMNDRDVALQTARDKLASMRAMYRRGPEVIAAALGLSSAHMQRNDLEQASAVLDAVARDESGSPSSPALAHSLGLLAHLRGDYDVALQHYAAAGRDADTLSNMAAARAASGDIEQALVDYDTALSAYDEQLHRFFDASSEAQRMRLLAGMRHDYDAWLTLVMRAEPARRAVRLFEFSFRHKAIIAHSVALQRLGSRPAVADQLARLRTVRERLAAACLDGRARPADVDALEAERLRLEIAIADGTRTTTSIGDAFACRARIAAALPAGTVLVDFVRFVEVNFRATHQSDLARPARYLAVVMRAGDPDNLAVVDLGAAPRIDACVSAFRFATGGTSDVRAAVMRDADEGGSLPEQGSMSAQALRRLALEPLRDQLRDAAQLLICPDAALALLPFELLPWSDTERLFDRCMISYVDSTRDCISPAVNRSRSEPVVIADPDFDLGFHEGNARFQPLAGTRQEGIAVAALLGVDAWMGASATTARLECVHAPRILHIATHGYFARRAPQHDDATEALLRVVLPMAHRPEVPTLPTLSAVADPHLRSGLAFAGANASLARGDLDGLLTADAVATLDLLGTELVVLSACETGLGDVVELEGVMGLRRAVTMAGARTLIVSLWRVPDEATQRLMVDVYRRLLAGAGRARALHDAKHALRERYPDPYVWAAFICIGDTGPLA